MSKDDISVKNIIIILIMSLLIVIFHNINFNWYVKDVVIPYMVVLVSYIYLFRNNKINKNSLFYLIFIILILVSNFIVDIDISNKILNIFIIPVLSFIFFFSWLDKNFRLSGNFIPLLFKIFPSGLITNLGLLKRKDHGKSEKVEQIILGICLGGAIGFILLSLLVSADAYFNAFIDAIFKYISVSLDISNILLFAISFIVLFSVYVNVLKNIDFKVEAFKKQKFLSYTVITILSIINFIYMLFVISEISKLTNNFLRLPTQYTYAGYAREGFFQLLFVTIINYGIIIFLMIKGNIIKRLCVLLIIFSLFIY